MGENHEVINRRVLGEQVIDFLLKSLPSCIYLCIISALLCRLRDYFLTGFPNHLYSTVWVFYDSMYLIIWLSNSLQNIPPPLQNNHFKMKQSKMKTKDKKKISPQTNLSKFCFRFCNYPEKWHAVYMLIGSYIHVDHMAPQKTLAVHQLAYCACNIIWIQIYQVPNNKKYKYVHEVRT